MTLRCIGAMIADYVIGWNNMKCFECGHKCVTLYHKLNGKIVAVSKVCEDCGWQSFPTRVPEPLS